MGRAIDPRERSNWNFINYGQKLYSWRQYNVARRNRGFSELPFPEDASTDISSSSNVDTASTTGAATESNSQLSSKASESESMATPAKRPREDTSAALPGTGNEPPSAPAEENAVAPIPQPYTNITSYIRYYRKVHRILTFGIAYKILHYEIKPSKESAAVIDYFFMTTPLATVPWDYLFWYLNPSEFDTLPDGSSVNKVKCTIRQRRIRVAFPTNSSDSNLATLNQNKNMIIAHGLNKKLDFIPIKYITFKGTVSHWRISMEMWEPTYYNALNVELYGPTTFDSFKMSVPQHQVGITTMMPIYGSMVYRAYEDGTTKRCDGWQCLQEHYKEYIGDDNDGAVLDEVEYVPQQGIVKRPIGGISRKFTDSMVGMYRGSATTEPRLHAISINRKGTRDSGSSDAATITEDTSNSQNGYIWEPLSNSIQLIEKSQIYYNGLGPHHYPPVGNSLHVGVQPQPALTTTLLTRSQSNSSFTDSQGYFEIIADIEINTLDMTLRPLARTSNVSETAFWQRAKELPDYSIILQWETCM
uniref:VP n=1 Tax=Ambidensovirus sp. TaxID=2050976 RepID=A0A6C1EHW9_9VIRU|nr:VP [Ambidensovirus sp.]